ncbi:acylneuraminate cytidylyltransferase family protein, partial [Alphaproteobacteria bacterium]|nr:acylneuraminate cytidylyltransferase family protein [Alphaproteobacteria bacterium]
MMPDYFSHEESLFISLPATSPLRTVGDIDNAITTYNSTKSDLVLAISPSHRSPYLNMVECDEDGSIKVILDGKGAFRRQDVPDVYDITTLIYVSTAEYIMNCSSILEGVVGHIKVPYERAIDIDFPADLVIAEALLNYQLAED